MRQRAQRRQPESAGSVPTGPSGQSLPDLLADADWVQAHLADPGVVPVEITEDTRAYDQGHIKGAVKTRLEAGPAGSAEREASSTGAASRPCSRGVASPTTTW